MDRGWQAVLAIVAVGAQVEVQDRAQPSSGPADPDEVNSARRRDVVDAPASLAKAETPVRVLPEEEEPLVEEPDLLPCRPTRDEAGAGQPVNLDRGVTLDRESG